MRIVYSYVGPLPDYTMDTIRQTRFFFKGPIYFILNDLTSPLVSIMKEEHQVIIVPYEQVVDKEFNECIDAYFHKFTILDVKHREKLFIYAFERFFLLYQLMKQENLTNIFFIELDNLIYDNPLNWENGFCASEMAFMFDNYDRCASGICFIKHHDILSKFRTCCIEYIVHTDITRHFMTEMQALDQFWKQHPHEVQILPTHWPSSMAPPETYQWFQRYGSSIFDSAGLGIYFGGIDPMHTNGLIMTGLRAPWSAIDYTPYHFEWKKDEEGRLIPYVRQEDQWIRINNLHIHSKQLRPHLSIE